jgi:hypothetical protein
MTSAVRYHVRLLDNRNALAARLLASDTYFAGGGGYLNAESGAMHRQLRSLFAIGGPADGIVITDPLTGLPIKLVPAEVEGSPGEVLLMREVVAVPPAGQLAPFGVAEAERDSGAAASLLGRPQRTRRWRARRDRSCPTAEPARDRGNRFSLGESPGAERPGRCTTTESDA